MNGVADAEVNHAAFAFEASIEAAHGADVERAHLGQEGATGEARHRQADILLLVEGETDKERAAAVKLPILPSNSLTLLVTR